MPRILTTVVVLAALGGGALFADGLYLNGVSPRSIGRGGTNLGFADNGGVIFDNPAAMTNVEGYGLFDVTADLLFTNFEYSDPANAGVGDSRGTLLPQVSAIYKLPDDDLAFGLGVFAPAGFSEQFKLNGPAPFVGPRHYESYGSLIKVLPAVAWQPTERLSLGGTIGVAFSRVRLEGPYFLQSAGLPILADLDVDGYGVTGSAGMQYQLTDTTTLGFTWQSQININLDGSTNVTVAPLVQTKYDTEMAIEWPRSLAFGVRQVVKQKHVVAADLTWLNWGDSFDNEEINFTRPSNPLFPAPISDPFPLRWHDTVSMRLGYEYDLGCHRTFRLGYVYHPTPIPNATLTPFIQAITEHAFSTGYGFRAMGWDVDLAYMFTTGDTQRVGTSAFVGGDFSNSSHTANTHAACVSLIKRF